MFEKKIITIRTNIKWNIENNWDYHPDIEF